MDPSLAVALGAVALWVVSLCLHEYAHARVAYAGGDQSVVEKGYLSLNPLRYVHPMTSIVMPLVILALGGIALPGGAVWIDQARLRSRGWISAVAAAGPGANLLLLVLAALPFTAGMEGTADVRNATWVTMALFVHLQAFALVLNLLPLPPLDGFGILEPWLPRGLASRLREFSVFGFFLLLIVLISDNEVGRALFTFVLSIPLELGVPLDMIATGWRHLDVLRVL